MKSQLLAVFLAGVAMPAFAADIGPITSEQPVTAPQVSGHLDVYIGGLKVDFDGDGIDLWSAGGTGRLNIPINTRWNIQGDLFADRIWNSDGDLTGYGAAVHGYWRNPDAFAFGAFGTYSGYDTEFPDEISSFTVGPEAQFYAGNWTLYGQAWYGQLDMEGTPFEPEFWGARGVVRYFATPNLRFDGELAFERLSVDIVDEDFDTISAAAQVMYRFSGTPLSLYGRYQYDHISVEADDVDLHKFVVGLRGTFGAPTLLDEDRSGATMDVFRRNLILPIPLI